MKRYHEPEAMTELHPSRTDPLNVGTRVRLHSGCDVGTVTSILNEHRVAVRLDTGQLSTWHQRELVIMADQKPFRGSDDGTCQTIPPR